jgi:hypothetical protein
MGVMGVGFDFARAGYSEAPVARVVRLTNYCALKSVGWPFLVVKLRRFPLLPPAVLVNDTGVRVPNVLTIIPDHWRSTQQCLRKYRPRLLRIHLIL